MDVAGVVVFLASSAASLITGETILIDGGWTAHVGEYSSLARHLRRNYVTRRRRLTGSALSNPAILKLYFHTIPTRYFLGVLVNEERLRSSETERA
jgi:hypothetical protein